VARFAIRFERSYRALSSALLISPSDSFVEIDPDEFRAHFPRAAVAAAAADERRSILSRGVHGFGGRWLVNGSAEGVVRIELEPPQRARVVGFPVRLKTLRVSVEDPAGLVAALLA
jgi:hypothetical protein